MNENHQLNIFKIFEIWYFNKNSNIHYVNFYLFFSQSF